MSQQYTDYLGNPINVGDVIVYPIKSGSSAADLNTALVIAIDDLIPVNPHDPTSTRAYARKDRAKADPPSRSIPKRWVYGKSTGSYGDAHRDDSKAYMLTIQRLREGASGHVVGHPQRKITLTNVDRVVVVSSLTEQREPTR